MKNELDKEPWKKAIGRALVKSLAPKIDKMIISLFPKFRKIKKNENENS